MNSSQPSEPIVPPPAQTPPTAPAEDRITPALGFLLVLGVLGALAVSFIKALGTLGGFPSDPEEQGAMFGMILGPFILAGIAVGIYYTIRKTRRSRRAIATSMVLWSLVFSFSSWRNSTLSRWPHNEHEMGQAMALAYREASGAVPKALYSRDEMVVTMREIFAEVIQFRQQYAQEAARFQTPELENLYAPASFKNKQVMEETVRQLKNVASIEEKYSSTDRLFASATRRVEAKDWPGPVKRSFLKGMEGSMREGQGARLAVFRKEREWLDASVDLYTFVLDNQPAFSVRGKTILVSDGTQRDLFNQKLARALELRRQTLQAQDDLLKKQAAQVGKYGLRASDFGLPQP